MDKHYRIPLTGPQIEQKLMEQSVPLQQGADNAGKVLAVDADGNVKSTPVETLVKDKLSKPETAKVGDLISVKEVDENGKVTATDVVDISAEAAMEFSAEMGLIDPTVDENGAIYTDENGLIYTL